MADDTVFLTAGQGRAGTFHTDPDCHLLNKSDAIREKVRGELPTDYQECRDCAGDDFRSKNQEPALRNTLAALDPEDVGLSPMLDRQRTY